MSSGKVSTVEAVRFEADSPEDLRTVAADARVGDRARVRFRDRTLLMIAVDGGPFGLVWEELRGQPT